MSPSFFQFQEPQLQQVNKANSLFILVFYKRIITIVCSGLVPELMMANGERKTSLAGMCGELLILQYPKHVRHVHASFKAVVSDQDDDGGEVYCNTVLSREVSSEKKV